MREMLSVTVAPRTVEALDHLSERYDLSRGRLVDAAIDRMLAEDREGKPLPLPPHLDHASGCTDSKCTDVCAVYRASRKR